MKRLGRVLGSLLAVALTVFSLQAFSAAQMGGRDFNHMTTGFILSGGHAVAACETCHIGGVFKGTPRACDGCHAVGKRIIATPKTNTHVVTDAQCDSCHFNTATWLGARYNHGTAIQGQCTTCHNGRIAQGKGSSSRHTGIFANYSCDSCHRTSTWTVAGWNHTNNASINYSGQSCDSSQCHSSTGMASTLTLATAVSHMAYPTQSGVTFSGCQSCHVGFSSFSTVRFNHAGATTGCINCHNGSFKGVRAMPTNHVGGLTYMQGGTVCSDCHSTTSAWVGMNHSKVLNINTVTSRNGTPVGTTCRTCHQTGVVYFGGQTQKSSGHEGMSASQDCISCHTNSFTGWNEP